mmetsp:Transcript_27742/g.61096  ORF Transcript_27742/g.61096 Transcript_27742/m.61096 type:complete len:267 (+) Transcript_27742:168-968(+)
MNDDYETRKLLLKQGEYRKLYSSLLQKHRGVLQTQPDEGGVPNANENTNAKDGVSSYKNSNHFEEEDRVLNQIFQTEVKNVAMGIGATAVALASLRFARSRHAASTVFGSAKAKVLQEAEIEGKRVGTDTFQKSFANIVEGMFSLWVGYRCYDHASEGSKDSIDAIAELPLCKGRSRVAEALCPEWIEITKEQIPDSFWKALAENKLREERTWAAIQTFSSNCERRLAAERSIHKESSSPVREEPTVLTKRVSSAYATDTRTRTTL